MIFGRKPFKSTVSNIGNPKDIIFKLELNQTIVNQFDNKVDMYLLYWDSRTKEMISLGIPHGRQDIAQYIQEKLNK